MREEREYEAERGGGTGGWQVTGERRTRSKLDSRRREGGGGGAKTAVVKTLEDNNLLVTKTFSRDSRSQWRSRANLGR